MTNKEPAHSANNDLWADFSTLLNYTSCLRIGNWSQGIRWTLHYEKETEHGRWHQEAPLPLAYILSCPEYRPWVQTIPDSVLQKIKPYSENEFSLLYLCSRYASVYELFLSNPTLVWLLLRQAKAQHWDTSDIVQLSQQKRTHIAQVCGLPASPLAVKIVQRLKFKKFGISALEMIQQLFYTLDYRRLSHVQRIDELLIQLLVQFPRLQGSRLVSSYQPGLWPYRIFSKIADCQRLAEQLGNQDCFNLIGHCKNPLQLQELHDRLATRLNENSDKNPGLKAVDYAPPPLPGTATIIPITHSEDLRAEGRQMEHCVAAYHTDITKGYYYVYRITYPERATLGLILNPGEKPCIDQLQGVRNQLLTKETYDYVKEWFLNVVDGDFDDK